jgi:hypothetical protein
MASPFCCHQGFRPFTAFLDAHEFASSPLGYQSSQCVELRLLQFRFFTNKLEAALNNRAQA